MIILGTWIPEDSANPHMEICHAFVYRWLIGRGRMAIAPTVDPMTGPFNGGAMGPVLWPHGVARRAVRAGGVNAVRAGDIIGFFDTAGALAHSMIAETPTTWVGANNQGCFGTGTGRTRIQNVYTNANPPLGWTDGAGNRFTTMGGPVTVFCRTP